MTTLPNAFVANIEEEKGMSAVLCGRGRRPVPGYAKHGLGSQNLISDW